MGKALVVYSSKYGSTKQYAEIIAKELSAELCDVKSLKPAALSGCDSVVYGGGVYAGSVRGLSDFAKKASGQSIGKLAVFTCGISDPAASGTEERMNAAVKGVLPDSLKEKTTVFCLRGGLDYTHMGFMHKLMMSMLHKAITSKKPEELTDDDKGILETYGKSVSFVSRENVKELIDFIKA